MTSLSYLQKKNQRRILGGVLAAASVLICGIFYSWQTETFLPLADADGPEKLWLQRYAMAQYNGLFDKANRSEVFFGQYLP